MPLVYTSFSAATEAQQPSQLLQDANARQVLRADRQGRGRLRPARREALPFRVRDRKGPRLRPRALHGSGPDPFREGREVIVTGTLQQRRFVGERDSLVTKCPSKFTKKHSQ